jgi:two-component system response regulator RegA
LTTDTDERVNRSAMTPRAVERVLVVEDNASLARSLQRTLGARFAEVRACQTRAEAAREIGGWHPQLLILDVALPDGDAFDVLRDAAGCEPAATVVAMSGTARTEESFALARLGVRAFLRKPITPEALTRAIDEALSRPPDLRPHVREVVGHRPIHEVEAELRDTMVDEALARSGGSRRGAARLLEVSRQLLQHILRRREG